MAAEVGKSNAAEASTRAADDAMAMRTRPSTERFVRTSQHARGPIGSGPKQAQPDRSDERDRGHERPEGPGRRCEDRHVDEPGHEGQCVEGANHRQWAQELEWSTQGQPGADLRKEAMLHRCLRGKGRADDRGRPRGGVVPARPAVTLSASSCHTTSSASEGSVLEHKPAGRGTAAGASTLAQVPRFAASTWIDHASRSAEPFRVGRLGGPGQHRHR